MHSFEHVCTCIVYVVLDFNTVFYHLYYYYYYCYYYIFATM